MLVYTIRRVALAETTVTRDALAVLQPGFTGTTAPDWLLRRLDEGLAAVGLFARNIAGPRQLADLTAELRKVRPDVVIAVDEEGGDVTRLEARRGSSFPGSLALGVVDDTGLTHSVAAELGRRLAECGVTLDWAPSADVNTDPDNPVIGVRSFGADPALVARHTAAYVAGLQSAGVAACAKHFPGHGDTSVDSHESLPRIDVPYETLAARDLPPFRAAVSAGVRAIMTAHILTPALDPTRPATLSRRTLDLLRHDLGYDGLIITDGMEMRAVADTYGVERGAVLAIDAGADAICVGGGLSDGETVIRLRDALVTAVHTGDLAEERLAEAAGRVRALARWTTTATRAHLAANPGIGLEAARRALRVTCPENLPLMAPPYVAAFTPLANMAVGDETPWGLAPALAELLTGTGTGTFTGLEAGREALSAAADRRIVAVVRDEHRHPWMSTALTTLLDARPDTVVVEMGVPHATPRGAAHIATYGAARVCGWAAAEVIAGVRGA
ncbi:glycoside hydrolase family 3 protein [Streptomyces acidiscabies]|uniref:glycoside hydrolase family 3 protein n=1 Tax=Streptomyces acidiscabies TaxID=42234 RepID=UPI00095187FD|nr:glycoside hydrolase family 3 N-terminal domain-containing protein [Streptomyces acidiscabies]